MKKFRFVASIAAALLALSACGHKMGVDSAAVEDEVKRGMRDWLAAYNGGDIETVVKRFAADAVVMPPGTAASAGSEEVRKLWAEGMASLREEGLAVAVRDGDSVGVSGDVAWHSGAYFYKTAAGPEEAGGHFMEVLEKRDGQWLVARLIWNEDHVPPEPAASAEAAPADPAAEPTG
jgi:ketosteroid isomerase-like protein